MIPAHRVTRAAHGRHRLLRASAANDPVRPKTVNPMTMPSVPPQVNSGWTAMSRIHSRASTPSANAPITLRTTNPAVRHRLSTTPLSALGDTIVLIGQTDERGHGRGDARSTSPQRHESATCTTSPGVPSGWRSCLSAGSVSPSLRREIRNEKFTLAELDEEEQNVDRLRRWHRELRSRDVFDSVDFATIQAELDVWPRRWSSSRIWCTRPSVSIEEERRLTAVRRRPLRVVQVVAGHGGGATWTRASREATRPKRSSPRVQARCAAVISSRSRAT